MKHLFIINPAAGSKDRTAEYSQEIHRLCRQRELDYDIRVSTAPGECRRFAREAAQTGEEVRIYACGGDGTLNEVAAGADGYDVIYALYNACVAAGVDGSTPAADVCAALQEQFATMTVDGLTGSGMTWDANGMISKAPAAMIVKDGAYAAA